MKTTAIILAAGIGKRLGAITKKRPKALITVGEKTLLSHTIDFVKKLGVTDIVVVGGFYFNDVKKEALRCDPQIKVVENKNYKNQNLMSVKAGLDTVVEGNIFICNIDYIKFDHTVKAMQENFSGISVFVSFDLKAAEEDVMKIKVDKENNLKAISKKLTDFDGLYTGDFFCAGKYLLEFKKAVVDAQVFNDPKIAVTEHSFLELIKQGLPVKAVDVGPADWCEIDTPEELELARIRICQK